MMKISLDSTVVAELKELLAEGFCVLVERFVEDGQHRIDLIEQAITANDTDVVYNQAHGLKGSARNVGATILAEYFGDLETMGHQGNLSEAGPIVAAGKTEFAAVCQALTQAID